MGKERPKSLEVEKELKPVCLNLAKLIVANQNLYPAPTNWDAAALFTANYVKTYALGQYMTGEGLLNDTAAEIISSEIMAQMEQAAQELMNLMQ